MKIYLTKQKKESAQGLVEFALILPMLLLVIIGIFEIGRLMLVYSSITSASREGARYGSAVGEVSGVPRYQDCDGIRAAALRIGAIVGLGDGDITIQYDDGADSDSLEAACPPSSEIGLADRIVVTTSDNFEPVVPLIAVFFPSGGLPITSTTARTIIKDVGIKGTPAPTSTPLTGGLTCYVLTLGHTGMGTDPVASPANSDGCPENQYIAGATINLSGAIADTGWEVNGWTETDDDSSTLDTNALIMPFSDRTALVNYIQICYPLTLSVAGNGADLVATPANSSSPPHTITCSAGEYVAGEVVSLEADPDDDWFVSSWSGSDDDTSSAETNQVTMPASVHAASVVYEEVPATCYELTVGHTGDGDDPNISPASSVDLDAECGLHEYTAGEKINLSGANPASGWQISGWSGTDNNGSTASSNTVTMPASDHTANVDYDEIPPEPTPEPTPTPDPVCRVTVSLYSTGDFKASWEIENIGDQILRMDWLTAQFPYFPNEYGNLVGVAFEDPIWSGSISSPATINSWNEGIEADRYLNVGETKLLAFTFEKKGKGYQPNQLHVQLPSIDGGCTASETWESGD